MAKRKKRQTPPAPIPAKLQDRFRKLMAVSQPAVPATEKKVERVIAGFPVIKGNELWSWDTLENVSF